MLKYVDAKIVFAEIPDEITLAINISNCPCHCKGCHSPYLAKDIGEPLIYKDTRNGRAALNCNPLSELIEANSGITCVCFMGGDSNPKYINILAAVVKSHNLKAAWYSGRQELSKDIDLKNFDFIKLGPYIEELGPLNSKTTNQRFYKVDKLRPEETPTGEEDWVLLDITDEFWKE